MRSERLPGDGPDALAARLRELVPGPESVDVAVSQIIAAVRRGGDGAVLDYTRRFDTGGNHPLALVVDDETLDAATARLQAPVRTGLERAIANVRRVAEAAPGLAADSQVELGSHTVRLRQAAVAAAGVYVPGGRAAYPSTVVMGVVPARVAGVGTVAVCAPPGPDGEIDHTVLAACRLAEADVVYRMGGAQAIAALAYGTESVAPVDVIVGPGNLYVQEAKRQVSGAVGIDGFAGPSDLVVLAGPDADPATVAFDVLAQAEHGPGTLVVAASTSSRLLDAVAAQTDRGAETGAVLRLVELTAPELGLALAEALAPEHLELIGPEFERLAPRITRAGCLFVGANAGTAFGDYIAGSNHILPTAGAARFASGLSPEHFRRRFAEVEIREPRELARLAAPVAEAEGFTVHAQSMRARIRNNRGDDA
jgi:histidinol dehydrogenase